jgi:EmrB/QacA subfamily drug resistance transporter
MTTVTAAPEGPPGAPSSDLTPAPVPDAHGSVATGFHDLPRRQLVLTVAGLMLAMFLGALDQTIVGTAMPRVIADLHGFEHYAWVTTAYMLTSTLGVPVFGKLSDLYGRKYIYIAGVLTFLVGSWLSGQARSMEQLAAFRAVQGVGAGINEGLAFAIIGDIFPPAKRARMQGMFGAIFGLSSIIGPTLGGWLTDNFSWRWNFYVNVPVGLAALAMLWFFFPYFKPDASVRRKIDWLGVVTLLGSATPFLLALSLGGQDPPMGYPWGSPQITGLFAVAAVMFAAFVAVETWQARSGGEPILPLELFKNPIYTVGVITTVIIGFGMFGTILYIPLYMQGVLLTSATDSGKVLWPMMGGMLTASIGTGQLIQRWGRYKWFGVGGLAIMTFGMFLFSRMAADTSYFVAARNMVVAGFGLGMTFPVFSLAVQNAVPYRVMGIAMSSMQFFRTLGGMMGTAILGAFMTNTFRPEFESRAEAPIGQLSQAFQSLPAQVVSQLPSEALQAMKNPAALFANPLILLSPEAMGQLRTNFQRLPGGEQILDQMLSALRASLAVALDRTFAIGCGILVVGFVAALFLGEKPLRKSNRPEAFTEHGGHGTVSDGGAGGQIGHAVEWAAETLAAPSDVTGVAVEAEEGRRVKREVEEGEAIPIAGD